LNALAQDSDRGGLNCQDCLDYSVDAQLAAYQERRSCKAQVMHQNACVSCVGLYRVMKL
jgi:hypothetical protein